MFLLVARVIAVADDSRFLTVPSLLFALLVWFALVLVSVIVFSVPFLAHTQLFGCLCLACVSIDRSLCYLGSCVYPCSWLSRGQAVTISALNVPVPNIGV